MKYTHDKFVRKAHYRILERIYSSCKSIIRHLYCGKLNFFIVEKIDSTLCSEQTEFLFQFNVSLSEMLNLPEFRMHLECILSDFHAYDRSADINL